MHTLLQDFWKWLKEEYEKTREEYGEEGLRQDEGEEEDNYPKFDELIHCAKEIIRKNILDEDKIYDLITVMALDNELEGVLKDIVEYSSSEQVEVIVNVGITHFSHDSRWQITELLYQRRPKDYYEKLLILSKDRHFYVRRRAKNCLEYLREEGEIK